MTKLTVTFVDDVTNAPVELFTYTEEAKPWVSKTNKRTYYEIFQSNRRTRVKRFYSIDAGSTKYDVKKMFEIGDKRFTYELCDAKYTPSRALDAALRELAEKICEHR